MRDLLISIGVTPRVAEIWESPLTEAAQRFEIDTIQRRIAWLANLAHECDGFTRLEENLRYSARRLLELWPYSPRREWGFTLDDVMQFAGRPELIANRVYANRYGNGDEASGDGHLFRGRSPIMLTFRGNYRTAGNALDLDLEDDPDLALQPRIGAMIAGWFWDSRDLNTFADVGDHLAIRRAINGGLNGIQDVIARVRSAEHIA